MIKQHLKKHTGTYYFIGLILIIVLAAMVYAEPFVYLERQTVDSRMNFLDIGAKKNIVLIGITEEDISKIGPLPWSRDIHARAINKLTELEPAVIGYDVIFSGAKDNSQDDKLVEATRNAKNVVYPVYAQHIEEQKGIVYGADIILPFDELALSAASLGYNTFLGDPDTVVRRIAPVLSTDMGTLDSFPLALEKQYTRTEDESLPNKLQIKYGPNTIPVDEQGLMTLMFASPEKNFKIIPFHKLLSGALNKEDIKGKIIIVGGASPGAGNFYNAPKGANMSELEFEANALNTIMSQRFFREMSKASIVITILIMGIATIFLFALLSPLQGLILMLTIWFVYGGIAYYATYKSDLFLEMTSPLLTVFLTYGTSVIYGYISERKEKSKITQTFGRYVAPQVVNEILKYGEFSEVKSKKQEVTVLFVDLSGFTPLSESLPPEQLVEILNEYLELVIRIVYKFEGTIDKFIGDAVMVIFNAPIPVEKHELKAVAAALEIQSDLVSLSDLIEARFDQKISASIGINTGEVVLGNIGALNRVEYAAIGDNVNIAARLQSLAKGGQIIISSSTYSAIESEVIVTPLGKQKVKGKLDALEVYQVDELKL
ncbi:MAG: adenylate/guanylate cyclase domain-containing protein [Syntrophomonadaceae bacterium]|nr:adenylate/guanylate cyclase domain-containing protein [Syntrophomonadaceae bacterium]